MIAYEELCDALARWRAKNGMGNGPSSRPMRSAPAIPVQAAPPPAPVAPAFVMANTAPELDAEDETSTHLAAPEVPLDVAPLTPKREDSTSEIDIDGIDVLEEESDV